MLVRTNSDLFGWSDFDRFFDGFVTPTERKRKASYVPAYDVEETESHYLLSLDVPGVARENLNVAVEGNTLTISGERRAKQEKEASNLRYFERAYGKFSRSFKLPEDVDGSKLEAQHQDGVLQVALPKAESAKPRSIEIKNEAKGFFQKLIQKDKETA